MWIAENSPECGQTHFFSVTPTALYNDDCVTAIADSGRFPPARQNKAPAGATGAARGFQSHACSLPSLHVLNVDSPQVQSRIASSTPPMWKPYQASCARVALHKSLPGMVDWKDDVQLELQTFRAQEGLHLGTRKERNAPPPLHLGVATSWRPAEFAPSAAESPCAANDPRVATRQTPHRSPRHRCSAIAIDPHCAATTPLEGWAVHSNSMHANQGKSWAIWGEILENLRLQIFPNIQTRVPIPPGSSWICRSRTRQKNIKIFQYIPHFLG